MGENKQEPNENKTNSATFSPQGNYTDRETAVAGEACVYFCG
jgi:hypothetical protein